MVDANSSPVGTDHLVHTLRLFQFKEAEETNLRSVNGFARTSEKVVVAHFINGVHMGSVTVQRHVVVLVYTL